MLNAVVRYLPRVRQAFLVVVLQGLVALTHAQGIYLQAASPVSRRVAMLEDDGVVAYLYLSQPLPRKRRMLDLWRHTRKRT